MKEQLTDGDLTHIAQCYSPSEMRTIGLQWFGFTQPQLDTIWENRHHDSEAFKRDVLINWRNKSFPTQRQVCLVSAGHLCDLQGMF